VSRRNLKHRTDAVSEPLEGRRLMSYTVTDLGSLGGSCWALAVNNAGEAVGYSYLPDGQIRAVRWQNGAISDLGTLGGTTGAARGINDSGVIVGDSRTADSTDAQTVIHACLWQGGVITDLGTLGGTISKAKAINSHGQVVGYSTTADGADHGVVWEGGVIYDLNALLPANSGWVISGLETNAINDNGQIVGQGVINGHQHAFRMSDNDGVFANGGAVITDLGTLGGPNSDGLAINNLVQAVGWSNTSAGSGHAFRFSGGAMTDLKSLYNTSIAQGINDGGQVVGASDYRGWAYPNQWHAFLWQGGKMADLNQQLPRGSPLTLEIAYDINRDGRIVGSLLVNGQRHAFMMTPAGAPSLSAPVTAPMGKVSSTRSNKELDSSLLDLLRDGTA
jgi:probable HAF family extracellular repeat protein